MSDTPRTDAVTEHYFTGGLRSASVVRQNFARELERELARVTAERDEAVDALKRIATYDYRGNQSGESQIARHALIAMRKGDGDGK
jgi:hypothetical protein